VLRRLDNILRRSRFLDVEIEKPKRDGPAGVMG
jgi:hypothetical protein